MRTPLSVTPDPQQVSIAKCLANETARTVTAKAVELHGGYGYHRDYHVERYARDAMGWAIAGGTPTIQRIRLGATSDGKLTSLMHDSLNHTSILDDYAEGCSEATPYSYSTPNLRATSGLVRRNVGTPTSMRGPGAVPG